MKEEQGDPSVTCTNCKHEDRPSSCSSLPWEREWWICDECNDELSEFEKKDL